MLVDNPKLLVGWRCPHGLGYLHTNVTGWKAETGDSRTHRIDVTSMGIVGYVNSLPLPGFLSFLDLVHRILVAGGTVYHVCSGVLAGSEMVSRCRGCV